MGEQEVPGSTSLPQVRAWRGYCRLGVRELGRLAGVGKTEIVELEAQHWRATAATYGKLANALKIKPTFLLSVNPKDLPEEERSAA